MPSDWNDNRDFPDSAPDTQEPEICASCGEELTAEEAMAPYHSIAKSPICDECFCEITGLTKE
jgi:hypothetical protein